MNAQEAYELMTKGKTVQDNDFFNYYDLIDEKEKEHLGDDEDIMMFRKSNCEIISKNDFLNFEDFMGFNAVFRVLSSTEQKELREKL